MKTKDDRNNNQKVEKEFKKIDIESFKGKHKCPLCGFEWDD